MKLKTCATRLYGFALHEGIAWLMEDQAHRRSTSAIAFL